MKTPTIVIYFVTAMIWQLIVGSAHGVLVTYDVNLSGVDPTTGHILKVTGTVSADTSTNQVAGSSLTVFHASDPGVAMPNLPQETGTTNWAWSASVLELRFVRVTSDAGQAAWFMSDPAPPNDFGQFLLGSGTGFMSQPHDLAYNFDPHGILPHSDFVLLKAISGPDAPGFLVGTAAIPEPSAFMFLSLAGLAVAGTAMWQKKRKQNPAARS